MNGDQGGSVGATPTVGQGGPAKAGVGKKKGKASQQSAAPGEEKDTDGSFRVPGYRGVWVNTSGKHFVKIDGERLAGTEGGTDLLFFDNIDDAARKHDSILRIQKKKNHNQKMELNFKADGSRVLYEDITPASTSGLGGSASNVVPALSVINIKVRQKRLSITFTNVAIVYLTLCFLCRICHLMSSHCSATLGRRREQAETRSDTSMPTVEYVDRPVKATTVGRVRSRSWESIITSVHSIQSGMPRRFMVSYLLFPKRRYCTPRLH